MEMNLSQTDVDKLITDPSPEVLVTITKKILYHYNNNQFTPPQLAIVEDILNILVTNIHVMVRKAMSEHLHSNDTAPREVILRLAQDLEEVSSPILQKSQVLTEEDLLTIISTTSQLAHYLAIAKRNKLPEMVSDALTHTGNQEVVKELLGNRNAHISDDTLQSIRERFPDNDSVIESLNKRAYVITETDLEAIGNLCFNGLEFFETTLASLAEVPALNARVLMRKPDGSGLLQLYQKAAFPEPLFEVSHLIYQLLVNAHNNKLPLKSEDFVFYISENTKELSIPYLPELITHMQQKASF